MTKKSQIQMGETIAVLFVFFILIVIGFIFYVKIIKGNIEIEKEEKLQLGRVGITQRIMFLPELQCSEDNIIITDKCVDILKLDSTQEIMKKNEIYYYDLLEFSNIKIHQIYPIEKTWDLYSRKIGDFSNKFVTNTPIPLYNPITRKYSFGVMTIETFYK